MNIEVVTIAKNEEYFMPFFLRHYAMFATKIHVYLHDCTDRTEEIVRACPIAEVHKFTDDPPNTYSEYNRKHFFNGQIVTSDADWLMLPDVDEILYHPTMRSLLESLPDECLYIEPKGFNMVSEAVPVGDGQIYEYVKIGGFSKMYSKHIILRPQKTNKYKHRLRTKIGRHRLDRLPHEPNDYGVKLLHYRYLGFSEMLARTHRNHDALDAAGDTNSHRNVDIRNQTRRFHAALAANTNVVDA